MRELGQGLAVLAVFVLFAAGCQSHTSDSPPSPTSPPAPAEPPPPPPELRFVPFGFGGPLFQPDAALHLQPGHVLHIPVMTAGGDFTGDGQNPGVSIFVRTDAPPTILSVSPQIWVGGFSAPGLVEIQAVESASSGEPRETYGVWLEEDPTVMWAEGWGPAIDDRALRIAVVETPSPPPSCETLELRAGVAAGRRDGGTRARLTFGAFADDFRSGTITLRTDHPDTSLSLLSRYKMPYEDLDPESDRARVQYHLYPTTFAFGLEFRETAGGFEQTMSLGWFDELHLRAEAPGCDAVDLSCDEEGRCSVGDRAP